MAVLITVVAGACMRILGFKEPGPKPFAHRAHVVEGISCVKCHRGIEDAGDTGALHLPRAPDCIQCHKEPHDTRPCGGCHGLPFTEQDSAQAKEHIKFSHATHLPRARGNCMRCHADAAQDGPVIRPPMASCFGCHAHEDQFETRDCDGCHVDLPAEMTRPESHLVHDGNFVREHGLRAAASADLCATCHTERSCTGCHGQTTAMLPERLAFDDVMKAGVHRAGFRSRHAEEARMSPGLCSTCHSESSCDSCHRGLGISAAAPDARNPHPAGWLGPPGTPNEHGRAAWRNPAECASCHGGAGEALCIGCHSEGGIGGNPHPPGWQSSLSQSQVPCRLCHRSGL